MPNQTIRTGRAGCKVSFQRYTGCPKKKFKIEFFEVRQLWALSGHFWMLWALFDIFGHSGHPGLFLGILGTVGHFWALWALLGTLGTFGHSGHSGHFWALGCTCTSYCKGHLV